MFYYTTIFFGTPELCAAFYHIFGHINTKCTDFLSTIIYNFLFVFCQIIILIFVILKQLHISS